MSLAIVTPSFVIVGERNLDRVRQRVDAVLQRVPGGFVEKQLFGHVCFLLFAAHHARKFVW
jgi:hypothetical protein